MSQSKEPKSNPLTDRRQSTSRSIFNVPTPIKQLFDKFPLLTYNVNNLPQRAPQHRNAHVLYVFTTAEAASRGVPSHNPACLKWQVRSCLPTPHSATTHTLIRHISSSPRSPFKSHQQTIMHHQVARCRSFYPLRPSRTRRPSQFHQGSCNDGS